MCFFQDTGSWCKYSQPGFRSMTAIRRHSCQTFSSPGHEDYGKATQRGLSCNRCHELYRSADRFRRGRMNGVGPVAQLDRALRLRTQGLGVRASPGPPSFDRLVVFAFRLQSGSIPTSRTQTANLWLYWLIIKLDIFIEELPKNLLSLARQRGFSQSNIHQLHPSVARQLD